MSDTPDLMPVLSRGKHRSPRKGACFMELASYLAGEPWSDHPSCTHPLLAALAREVNDHVQDGSRVGLAPLVPEVIGLNGDDPRVDAWIAREAALTALPIVCQEKQNVSAVALLLCERQLARLEGRADKVPPETQAALDAVPHARDWARDFISTSWGPPDFSRRSAPAIVHKAVSGIATAAVPDPDRVLVELLSRVIASCREWFRHEPLPVSDDQWRELCQLTRR
jgi:hypothetical protein